MQENQKDPGDEKLLILPLGEESKKITQVISNDTARQIIELLADAPLSASDIAERLQAPLTTVTYNLENLESVGLVKVERIKYSEKGREVKIFVPVRKLIVVVPDKTDKRSVADLLRKYLGVILAAVLASSLVEFFTRKVSRSANDLADFTETLVQKSGVPSSVSPSAPVAILNETAQNSERFGGMAQNITPVSSQSYVDISSSNISPSVTSTPLERMPVTGYESLNITPTPPPAQTHILEKGAASNAMPDILTRIADTITAHPGIVFLLGCLFMVALFVILDLRKKRKND